VSYGRFASSRRWAIPIALLALSLLVRVPALGRFNTVDEPRWIYRSHWFVAGLLFDDVECPPVDDGRSFTTTGWGCTFQVGYPGVTTMLGGSLGLLGYYWQAVRPTGVDLRSFLLDVDPLDPALIFPVRLPLAAVAALFLPLFYILVRRLLGERLALISALILALNPFHIALSRVLHHDALTTTFMVLSLLSMVGYWLRGWKRHWLIVSAFWAGLAFLSKPIGWFLMPYAALLGVLSLFHRWQQGHWRGWKDVWQVAIEGVLWGGVAWLTFFVLFPAMWVIPGQVIRGIVEVSTGFAEAGHEAGRYFLGRTSSDPGPLLYPIGWLLRASPLEVLGLLMLPVAAWRAYRLRPIGYVRRQLLDHPELVALALFVGTFLLFETLSSKKIVRFFLPAFPVIDIFVAVGLLWLWSKVTQVAHSRAVQRWSMAFLAGLVFLAQGWLVMDNFPYYFTYYNPLLGGARGAANIIGIGWGEGMNEAAAYLNHQPDAESLQVATAYHLNFIPFFVGEAQEFSDQIGDVMNADYLVYYRHQLQRRFQDINLWRYFEKHYSPVHRVTLQGLDYVLVYHNPIDHHVYWQENGLPGIVTPFGYDLADDGTLTLFWQNLGLAEQQELGAGLVATPDGETRWVVCTPGPDFASEVHMSGAIVESLCPLADAGTGPGFYDLRLAVLDGTAIRPLDFPAGQLAVSVDSEGRFDHVDPATALDILKERGLVTSLDVSFSDTARWVGYQFEPATWQSGGSGALRLYWEMNRRLDLWLINAFRVVLRLSSVGSSETLMTVTSPVFPQLVAARDVAPGAIVSVRYPVTLPTEFSRGEYVLDVCLTVADSGQPVLGAQAGMSEPVECLPLPVTVTGP
jgi:uncharacterized membrane protein